MGYQQSALSQIERHFGIDLIILTLGGLRRKLDEVKGGIFQHASRTNQEEW